MPLWVSKIYLILTTKVQRVYVTALPKGYSVEHQETHMATKKTRRQTTTGRGDKGETVPPVSVLKLMDAVGPSRASRLLGVSTTTLHKVRKHGLVSKVIEVAAHGALRDIGGIQNGHTTSSLPPATTHGSNTGVLILEADPAQMGTIERIVASLGARVIRP